MARNLQEHSKMKEEIPNQHKIGGNQEYQDNSRLNNLPDLFILGTVLIY